MNYRPEDLQRFVREVCIKAGLTEHDAADIADSLVFAELRGLSSHGLLRLESYLKRFELGKMTTGIDPEITADGGALMAVDGKNGMGICVAAAVMRMCMERAKQTGACIAAVNSANHFGCSAYFTKYAADHDMIGFMMGNAFRSVAPFGGAEPMLGTNPFSLAIPGEKHEPFVLDMATSEVAQGKLILARDNHKEIPYGWGVDKDGKPTHDPAAVLGGGSQLPFGGPKGYGFSMMIELLTVCLAGSARSTEIGSMYNYDRTQDSGFVMGALDFGRIRESGGFKRSVDELIESIKSSRKAEGVDEIFVAGEIEHRKELAAKEEGISLTAAVRERMHALGEHYGVAFPAE